MAEPNEEGTENAAPKAKRSKLIVIVVAAIFAAAATGGGVYWFTAGGNDQEASAEEGKSAKADEKSKKPKGPAIYVEFDPPFVVNFESKGAMRFLQVTIQIMTRDPLTADLIKQHDPVIRNDLLMLLSNQTQETIGTVEGKDQLRREALAAVAKVVSAEGGSTKSVEQLYFTSFVMQ